MRRITIYFLAFLLVSLTSCEKFLEEEYLSGINSDSIDDSPEAFETLVNSAYVTLRAWYGKENSWDLTEAGTDLYTYGLDNRSLGFCLYNAFTNAEEQERMGAVWRELYRGLNTCNLILARIDNVDYDDLDVRAQRKAEVQFLRAHYLWLITEIWGDVHFSTEPTETAQREANRTPQATFYDQIFADLHAARAMLPAEQPASDYGRITKPAAEAMLARAHLYHKNYDSAAVYANRVMNDYAFGLENDWEKLFAIDNIKNQEAVWAVNYSDDLQYVQSGLTDTEGEFYNANGLIQREGGNQGHVMYEIRYENLSWGMVRDKQNGRGFQRWMPTRFFIELYDPEVDERFYGSFKNHWICNSNSRPRWRGDSYFVDGQEFTIPDSLKGDFLFEQGDTAIYFSVTPVPESEKARSTQDNIRAWHPTKGYIIIDINDMYLADGTPNDAIINRQFYFPITKRYQDTTRLDLTTATTKRDVSVFRISEMYLIAAEAALMNNDKGTAAQMLNTLREARAVSGREADMRITENDVDIDFILDERGRELATEQQRFFDLKRTGKLVERVRAHNPDAAPFIEDYHALRFIPQNQIDAMSNGAGYQNPGY
ncbi:MAG: RagB/SusD family nutrient uptake outer membrane protein [Bacteroidia bacterium]